MRIETTEIKQIEAIGYKLIERPKKDNYVFVSLTYKAYIIINECEYKLIWQNGVAFYNNNERTPSNTLYLSKEGHCSEMMETIDDMPINEFDENYAVELNDIYSHNFSVKEYLIIKNVIHQMKPRFNKLYSSKPEDYDIEYIKAEFKVHEAFTVVSPK